MVEADGGRRDGFAVVVSLAGLAGVIGSLGYLPVAPTSLSPAHNAVSQ